MTDLPIDDEGLEVPEEENGDRAEALAEEVAKEYQEGSDFERIDEDTTAEFDAEDALGFEPGSDRHLPTPADSNQDDHTTVSERSTPSQRSESEPEKPAMRKKARKYQSALKKSKKRKADIPEPEEAAPAKRELRTRTPAQMNPFKADKVAHTISKSRGKIPSKAEIEKHLHETYQKTKARQATKPSKSSKSLEIVTSDVSSAASSSPEPQLEPQAEVFGEEYKRQYTTLRVIVEDTPHVGIEAPLAHFPTLTALFNFINNRWGRVKQSKVDHLTCQRPWKGGSSLAVYEDWDDQYKALEQSILEAPVWRKKSTSPPTLEVNIIVTLEKRVQAP